MLQIYILNIHILNKKQSKYENLYKERMKSLTKKNNFFKKTVRDFSRKIWQEVL